MCSADLPDETSGPVLQYGSALNREAPPLSEVLDRFVRELAGYTLGPEALIEAVSRVAGDPDRCMWITYARQQCRRVNGVALYRGHPAIPEDVLRLCAHHRNQLSGHLLALEEEGMTAVRERRGRMREWKVDRPERRRLLRQAMEKAAAQQGLPGVMTYAMVRERWVKIGRSLDVGSRYRSLLRGSAAMPVEMRHSAPLILLFTLPGDCETDLHHTFHEFRESGTEWFRHEGPVLEWTTDVVEAQQATEAAREPG